MKMEIGIIEDTKDIRVAQNLQKLKKELFTYGIRFLNILEAQNDMAQLSSFFVHLAQSTSILSKKVDISSFSWSIGIIIITLSFFW